MIKGILLLFSIAFPGKDQIALRKTPSSCNVRKKRKLPGNERKTGKVMSVFLENEYEGTAGIDCEMIAGQVVEAAVDYVTCPFECEVNLMLVGNEEIHRINLEQRGIDRPTDVLSFPMIEYENPGCFDGREEDPAAFHPDTGELMLGDIVISLDKAKEQAKAYGHSLEREYAFLIAHSMLHLFGYDHMEDEERAVMEEKQEEILQFVHYTRD